MFWGGRWCCEKTMFMVKPCGSRVSKMDGGKRVWVVERWVLTYLPGPPTLPLSLS